MSSHHIVREKQEPALLVLGLNHFTDDELGQLLEWSPTVIASPPVAEQLAAYGIKIDHILADQEAEHLQSDVKLIDLHGESWLVAALQFLVKNGFPAVNIVTDELDLVVYNAYTERINLVIFYNRQKIYPVTSGFRKWKPAGDLITLHNPEGELHTSGLEAIASHEFQTTADGFFSLEFGQAYLFIGEQL